MRESLGESERSRGLESLVRNGGDPWACLLIGYISGLVLHHVVFFTY